MDEHSALSVERVLREDNFDAVETPPEPIAFSLHLTVYVSESETFLLYLTETTWIYKLPNVIRSSRGLVGDSGSFPTFCLLLCFNLHHNSGRSIHAVSTSQMKAHPLSKQQPLASNWHRASWLYPKASFQTTDVHTDSVERTALQHLVFCLRWSCQVSILVLVVS